MKKQTLCQKVEVKTKRQDSAKTTDLREYHLSEQGRKEIKSYLCLSEMNQL